MARPRAGARPGDLALYFSSGGGFRLRAGDREGAERLWRDLVDLVARLQDEGFQALARRLPALLSFLDGDLETALAVSETSDDEGRGPALSGAASQLRFFDGCATWRRAAVHRVSGPQSGTKSGCTGPFRAV